MKALIKRWAASESCMTQQQLIELLQLRVMWDCSHHPFLCQHSSGVGITCCRSAEGWKMCFLDASYCWVHGRMVYPKVHALLHIADWLNTGAYYVSWLLLSLQGIWTVAFKKSMDALRFTHAAQMMLNHSQWSNQYQEYYGDALPNSDGRWLFHGPRVCMAVHETGDYFVSSSAAFQPSMLACGTQWYRCWLR